MALYPVLRSCHAELHHDRRRAGQKKRPEPRLGTAGGSSPKQAADSLHLLFAPFIRRASSSAPTIHADPANSPSSDKPSSSSSPRCWEDRLSGGSARSTTWTSGHGSRDQAFLFRKQIGAPRKLFPGPRGINRAISPDDSWSVHVRPKVAARKLIEKTSQPGSATWTRTVSILCAHLAAKGGSIWWT